MAGGVTSGDISLPESVVSHRIASARLLLGLLQGAALFFLYNAYDHKTWPATDGLLFAPLLLVALFVPVLLISALGHMQWRRLVLWGVIASVIVATIGYYDIWHISPDVTGRFGYAVERHGKLPSFLASFYTAVGLFIAHSLVLAGSGDRRWIAPYPAYFETAWKFIVQLKFAFLFVGVLWLVLWLGASLFMLLKLDFLQELLKKSWFSVPVSVFAFASALHLTDVRPGIVRGIRTLLLVLLSWLLPLATLIVFGFMASLPWTGLTPLWATRHATAVLLGAAAVLVVLINTAFQNGEVASQLARVLRWSGRLAALLLAPIVLIGIYSLGLRVGDYGWTSDRVFAAACLLVAACYAGGYAWAALSRGPWLGRVASTNVVTAFLILIVLLSLFSPIADPARAGTYLAVLWVAAAVLLAGRPAWRVALASVALPLAGMLAALALCGGLPVLWGDLIPPPIAPRWTAWASVLLVITARALWAVALALLATSVLPASDRVARWGTRRSGS